MFVETSSAETYMATMVPSFYLKKPVASRILTKKRDEIACIFTKTSSDEVLYHYSILISTKEKSHTGLNFTKKRVTAK